MKLFTKAIEKKFKNYPLYSQDGKGDESKVVVKFFNPVGAGTWLITEGQPEGPDFMMYGRCFIHEWEWGYVSLEELEGVELPLGMKIERDMYSKMKTVGEMMHE